MRAMFASGNRGHESDPALEPSHVGGHTLLQRRLSLYGKVLVVQSIVYWLVYAIIWGPTVGFARSLKHIVSWDVVLLTAIYSLYWVVARGRPRSAPVLLATDVIGSLAIGLDNVFLMLGDLGTISGVFENLIGFICILLLRALIVPSTVKRTLLCGLFMCGPSILGVAFGTHRFATAPVTQCCVAPPRSSCSRIPAVRAFPASSRRSRSSPASAIPTS